MLCGAWQNPHADSEGAACCPAQRLPIETLLPAPALLTYQADTFVKMRTRRHGQVPVQVFTFRQPARLSSHMLPFDLALVSSIDPTGIVEVPAPPAQAADSWFPDYAWDHWVVCQGTSATPTHLGWRFTRKPGATGAPGPQTFVALIVAHKQTGEAEAAGGARARVPLTVAATLREEEEDEAASAMGGSAAEPIGAVGVEAPGWMAAMVAALTARVASSSSK